MKSKLDEFHIIIPPTIDLNDEELDIYNAKMPSILDEFKAKHGIKFTSPKI